MKLNWMVGGAAFGLFVLGATGCGTSKSAQNASTADDVGEQLSTAIRQRRQGNERVAEYDLNGDKAPDVWVYSVVRKNADGKDVDAIVRKELDINWDGKIDFSRFYDEREQMTRESVDMDLDGKVDQVNYYEKGVIVRKERDLSSAGQPSLWMYYEKGKLVRKERDSNADGRVDYWEYWEADQVDRVGEDLDGDGNVDKWTKNPNAEG